MRIPLPRKALAAITAATAMLAFATAVTTATPQSAEGATATYKFTYLTLPNGTKVPLRWNGCQAAVTWKANLAAVPTAQRATVLAETKTAVSRIATYTGMTFSYKGSTTEVPQSGSMPKQSAELVIAYTTPSKTNYSLAGSILGQGGLYAAWVSRTSGGTTTYTTAALRGFVVLDTPQILSQTKPGFGAGLRRTNVVLHELGHAFGLAHVTTNTQQMYPSISSVSPNGMATGDRGGLYRLGKPAGCINTSGMPLTDLS
ncbi:matrixin family metalloprotease [Phycicoccus sp. Root101]|uniref:matrixin family metalloprotease n=1 Tax=Phycicoccus sp. Root101 TaxID=1736421 RepID=UPI000703AF7D|nr:matrixin family metalloprotease [Phycicoccus sp. Root101]KQU67590.1 hypothetical protein ASC58_13720 [Phycicoccus sp. Root101]